MRTRKQQLYDKIYYGFERWIFSQFLNHSTRKRLRGIKFDRAFYQEYRKIIRPYWWKYGVKPNIVWAKFFYTLTGSMDPRYIPSDIFARNIIPHFNQFPYMGPLADKNLNSMVFPTVKRPETAFKYISGTYRLDDFTIISREEALARCNPDGRYIIKPTRYSNSGSDIHIFSGDVGAEDLSSLLKKYDSSDYIVQSFIVQHPELSKLNPTSVNTLRLATLLFQGKPHLLPSAVLRIGGAGSLVDNVGAGGYQCPILPDGRLYKTAFTKKSSGSRVGEFVDETSTGIRFADFTVPSYEKVCSTVLDLAARVPHLGYIAWDIAVDKDGDPVLVEFNVLAPGHSQENCGPTFGDMTEAVLDEVFGTHFAE